jgi:hypothetical protein
VILGAVAAGRDIAGWIVGREGDLTSGIVAALLWFSLEL